MSASSHKPCIEGCGRKARTPRALRCAECHVSVRRENQRRYDRARYARNHGLPIPESAAPRKRHMCQTCGVRQAQHNSWWCRGCAKSHKRIFNQTLKIDEKLQLGASVREVVAAVQRELTRLVGVGPHYTHDDIKRLHLCGSILLQLTVDPKLIAERKRAA